MESSAAEWLAFWQDLLPPDQIVVTIGIPAVTLGITGRDTLNYRDEPNDQRTEEDRRRRRGALMAKSVNKVILLGTLGRDPEIKYTPSGMALAKFSIATNDRFKDKEGNWQDRTEWHNIVAFQRTAEVLGEYVKKGDRLYIEGKLQTSSWEDKQTGEKKYRTEIVANDVVLIGGRRDASGSEQGGGAQRRAAASQDSGFDQGSYTDDAARTTQITDEDIPF